MLSLLLDQQVSPAIADRIQAQRPDIQIASIYDWRGGAFVGVADRLILRAAADENCTLVTYDRRTIPAVLAEWGSAGLSHGVVVFIDNLTIRSNDYGRLVRALTHYWDDELAGDWTDRIGFLPVPTPDRRKLCGPHGRATKPVFSPRMKPACS